MLWLWVAGAVMFVMIAVDMQRLHNRIEALEHQIIEIRTLLKKDRPSN